MGAPTVLFVFATPPGTQWVPLTGTTASSGFCTPSIGLVNDGGGDVTLTSNATPTSFVYNGKNVSIYPSAGATLNVLKGKTPKFSFVVVDSSSPTPSTTAYFLCGLALKNITPGGSDNGGTSFPEIDINTDKAGATTLVMQDNNKASGTYDFWVMVQDNKGNVGLIDPLITNDA
jgi:hypothetical protein